MLCPYIEVYIYYNVSDRRFNLVNCISSKLLKFYNSVKYSIFFIHLTITTTSKTM